MKFQVWQCRLSTVCLLIFLGAVALAQDPAKPEQPPLKPGSITGRVLGDDGQPLAAIPVFAAPIGRAGAAGRRQGGGASSQTTTDDEGNFEFANLPPASYSIAATVPGYIAPPAEEETGAGIYRPGDAVTITLIKGGVITGKVVNATGEPLTGISVNAIRVGGLNGEEEDQTTSQGGFRGFQRNWRTDDRGVYRIYGLIPGSYIVQAGGNGGPNPLSPFSQDAPTYYPSSAREAAVPLAVRAGDEAAGIDINDGRGRQDAQDRDHEQHQAQGPGGLGHQPAHFAGVALGAVFGQDRHERLGKRPFREQPAQEIRDRVDHEKGVGIGPQAHRRGDGLVTDQARDARQQRVEARDPGASQ